MRIREEKKEWKVSTFPPVMCSDSYDFLFIIHRVTCCLGRGPQAQGSGIISFVDFNRYKTVWFNPGYVPPPEPLGSDAQGRR